MCSTRSGRNSGFEKANSFAPHFRIPSRRPLADAIPGARRWSAKRVPSTLFVSLSKDPDFLSSTYRAFQNEKDTSPESSHTVSLHLCALLVCACRGFTTHSSALDGSCLSSNLAQQ